MALHCEHQVAVACSMTVPSALLALRYSGSVRSSSIFGRCGLWRQDVNGGGVLQGGGDGAEIACDDV
jgi:hypothetical protein